MQQQPAAPHGLIAPATLAPSCALAVTPEPVVAKLLDVFRGMQLPQAEAAVRNTAGNYLDVDG